MIAVILSSLFSLSFGQTWTGQASVMDVPWSTNIYETDVKIMGDITAISQINGNYIQNGPGIWRYLSEHENLSVFLGLPIIRAFYFKNGTISFRARLLNDDLYRMMYDKNLNASLPFNTSNIDQPSCVTIRKINGNLLANGPDLLSSMLNETDLSVLESPYTYDDNFYLQDAKAYGPPHTQIDPNTNEIFHMFVGTAVDLPVYYQLYHIKPNTNTRILAPNKVYINKDPDKYGYVQHMNGLTKHFYIFCFSPPMVHNLTKIIWKIVDRYSGALVAEFTSDPFFYFHYPNSYEFIDETTNKWYIISDLSISYMPFSALQNASKVQNMLDDNAYQFGVVAKSLRINRFIFPLNQTGIHIDCKPLVNVSGQMMPVINYEKYNTMPYQYIYATHTTSVYTESDSLIKIKVPLITTHEQFIQYTQKWDASNLKEPNYIIWHPDAWENVNEPYFIESENSNGEDDGFIVDLVLNGANNSSYLLILNATTMEQIATVHPNLDIINGVLPLAFHARYYKTNT
eukprot:399922_1